MPPIDPAEAARMRVVYRLPGMDKVEVRRDLVYREIEGTPMTMDLYLPPPGTGAPDRRRGAVLLIHGGPIPEIMYGRAKNMGVFLSHGELLAASGLVAVAFNHLHHGWHDLDESAANIAAVAAHLRGDAAALRIDPDRLCLWAFSGGGPHLAPALTAPAPGVCCLVSYYALLDMGPVAAHFPQIPAETLARFSPAACLAARSASAPPRPPQPPRPPLPPMLAARAGRDLPTINQAFDNFLAAAFAAGLELEVLNHVTGQHGFDVLDDVDRTRQVIARTIRFIQEHCGAPPAASGLAGGAVELASAKEPG